MDLNKLLTQYKTLIGTLFAEGILDDQFTQLQQLQDPDNPDFVSEVVGIFFDDSERILTQLTQMLMTNPVNFKAVDGLVHQFKGSSASGPVVDKRAATLPSKYDGKGDITSWISSMRSYFEVMRTSPEDRSMIMGTNTKPAVRNFIELQAVTTGFEIIDLTEWLKVTSVRTLEDLLIARYQSKHAVLKARLKLEALKGQTWRTSVQALEQHLTGLFTTPDLGMTDVSCMDVVMGVAPKEYLSLLLGESS
ncbi:hypothetical protein CBR_g45775 [Chara braunii]|uniref:Histidine-containing phosphotransfer protein n=1 Tax=Chara braunii TaxID=69332 RepID=A0A388LZE1_CHABU|nr:hypothetical protein CBR_g45775 [Chara braunii]|eukprot:GBG87623.1 hypothetical protein CBR_g45775 [Chara braunii]